MDAPSTPVLKEKLEDVPWVSASVAGGFRTEVTTSTHTFVADEPADAGGGDEGPTPYEYLLAALASCTAMTMRMYADRKKWPLDSVAVRIRPVRSHAADCAVCETEAVGVGRLEREVDLVGALTVEQRARLLFIGDRCPVKQTLERGLRVVAAVR
jgi:putative redox protein